MKRDGYLKHEKRKMVSCLKHLNRRLRKDIFGDRFEVRCFRLDCFEYFDGSKQWVMDLEGIDHKSGQIDRIYNITAWDLLHSWRLFTMMNDLIVNSDFWELYRAKQDSEDKTAE